MVQKAAQSQSVSSKLMTQPQPLRNNTLNYTLIEVWIAVVDLDWFGL